MHKFKNESVEQIKEFIGLRAKLYTFQTENNETHNKCKGVKRGVAKTIDINEYRKTLYKRTSYQISQNGIRSYGHQIYTEKVSKIALSANDDKVFICDDNIHTRNHGHYLNYKKY